MKLTDAGSVVMSEHKSTKRRTSTAEREATESQTDVWTVGALWLIACTAHSH